MIQGQSNDMLLLLVCTDSAAAQHRSTHTTDWLCDELSAACHSKDYLTTQTEQTIKQFSLSFGDILFWIADG